MVRLCPNSQSHHNQPYDHILLHYNSTSSLILFGPNYQSFQGAGFYLNGLVFTQEKKKLTAF